MEDASLANIALAKSLRAIMRKKAFSKITVGEICSKAHMTRRNFYNHFLDKYDLLNWTYDYFFCQQVKGHEDWHAQDYLPLICQDLYRDMKFYRNAFSSRPEDQNSFREFCIGKLKPLFMRDMADIFQDDGEADFYVSRICNAFFDYYIMWFDDEDPMDSVEYINHIRESIIRVSGRITEMFAREPSEPERWKYGARPDRKP